MSSSAVSSPPFPLPPLLLVSRASLSPLPPLPPLHLPPPPSRAQAVADIIRTTLGPRSMLKMLLDATGGEVHATGGHLIGWWDGVVGWGGGMGWWDGVVGWGGGVGWWDGVVGWGGGMGLGGDGVGGGMGWWDGWWDGVVGWGGGMGGGMGWGIGWWGGWWDGVVAMGWWDGVVVMGWWDGVVGWGGGDGGGGMGWWDGVVGWGGGMGCGMGWWDGVVGWGGGMGWWDGVVGWGGIVLTNDGNAILREIDVTHPAAKMHLLPSTGLSTPFPRQIHPLLSLRLSLAIHSTLQARSAAPDMPFLSPLTYPLFHSLRLFDARHATCHHCVLPAGEMLHVAEPFLEKGFHPTVICRAYTKALDDAIAVIDKVAFKIDVNNRKQMLSILQSCIGTKFTTRFGPLMAELALDAVQTVAVEVGGRKEIDIKQYAKVEKVPGGRIEDSAVLRGVMFNKDVVTPGKMRRRIENPRVVLLDSPLEYKKGENQTNVELLKEEDWEQLLKMEEEYIAGLCRHIAAFKPDLVITEKGLSDLAAHYLSKAGIAAIRRLRKTDNNRIARAVGATIVNRVEELQESDVGTGAGLFEVRKIGDEFFAFLVECKEPKACTVLLRGASKDILNEMERNLQDAMGVARNVVVDPRLVPGGGAVEMTVSAALKDKAGTVAGIEQWPYRAVASAFEVIPRTLAQNCGVSVIRTVTALQAKHAQGANTSIGIDGDTGALTDMKELGPPRLLKPLPHLPTHLSSACMLPVGQPCAVEGWAVVRALPPRIPYCFPASRLSLRLPGVAADREIADVVWEPYAVKVQTVKTAIEAACMLHTLACIPLIPPPAPPPPTPGLPSVWELYAVKVQTVKTAIEAACMLHTLACLSLIPSLHPCLLWPCQVWEPYAVKVQTVKTAIEAACMLLRIDDIVSGLKKKQASGAPGGGKPQMDTGDDVDSEQMLAE
ncbi:unnamed protein product [Closterium sp. Naga37s-1]|nr:unnamed protein product [Closterium sp. Naga37s-1]